MSKRKIGLLLLLSSGYLMALGFGPLRIPIDVRNLFGS